MCFFVLSGSVNSISQIVHLLENVVSLFSILFNTFLLNGNLDFTANLGIRDYKALLNIVNHKKLGTIVKVSFIQ